MPVPPDELEVLPDEAPARREPSQTGGLVWVFQRTGGHFPSGVWSSKENAERWIQQAGAAGTLSAYVLDESAYDSNVRLELLKIDNPERLTREFRRDFTTAIDHDHYGND